MKSQVVILKVKYDDDFLKPQHWQWNSLIGCEDCIELLNYSEEEKKVDESPK